MLTLIGVIPAFLSAAVGLAVYMTSNSSRRLKDLETLSALSDKVGSPVPGRCQDLSNIGDPGVYRGHDEAEILSSQVRPPSRAQLPRAYGFAPLPGGFICRHGHGNR